MEAVQPRLKHMKELETFIVRMDSDTVRAADNLAGLFKDLGIDLKLRILEGTEQAILSIAVNTEQTERIAKRYAGRKQIDTNELVTLDQVMEMKKSMSSEEIAQKLGVSRATYFRMLRDTKERMLQEQIKSVHDPHYEIPAWKTYLRLGED